jgi:hypothetical protein
MSQVSGIISSIDDPPIILAPAGGESRLTVLVTTAVDPVTQTPLPWTGTIHLWSDPSIGEGVSIPLATITSEREGSDTFIAVLPALGPRLLRAQPGNWISGTAQVAITGSA